MPKKKPVASKDPLIFTVDIPPGQNEAVIAWIPDLHRYMEERKLGLHQDVIDALVDELATLTADLIAKGKLKGD